MKNGFTLVELSIVLVIIGLLIGGTLVGQSLIESAKISKEVSKLSQYSIAIMNFQQKFRQEAGDSTYFSPSGNNNGASHLPYEDGIVYDPSWTNWCSGDDESYTAWGHLSQAGMLKDRYLWNRTNFCSGSSGSMKGIAPIFDGNLHTSTLYFTEFWRAYGYRFAIRPEPSTGFRSIAGRHSSIGYNPNAKRAIDLVNTYGVIFGLENKLDDGVISYTQGNIYTFPSADYAADPTCNQSTPVCTATVFFGDNPIGSN